MKKLIFLAVVVAAFAIVSTVSVSAADACSYDECGFGFEVDFGCSFYDCNDSGDYYGYDYNDHNDGYYVGLGREYRPWYISQGDSVRPVRNQTPICADVTKNVRVGENVSFTISAVDYDRDVLTATSFGLPVGVQFDGMSRFFSWTPVENQAGPYLINFQVSDGKGGTCNTLARITVNARPIPSPIVIPAPAPVTSVRQPVYVPVYIPSPAPAPVQSPVIPVHQPVYNTNTNTVSSVNTNTNTNTIVINGLNDLLRGTGVQVNGVAINRSAPYFTTTPITNARANQSYGYWAQARDNDGDPISFRLLALPAGMTINPLTGFITWTPAASQAGVHQVVIEATDRLYQTIQSFAIIVAPAIAAPAPVQQTSNPVINTQTNTTIVSSQPQTVLVAPGEGALFAYNVRIDRDENGNTVIAWDTNQPSRGAVMYGLASQGGRTSGFTYEYTSPEHPELTTLHRVVLGELQVDRTYYFRTVSSVGSATHISQEFSFLQLPTGAVAGEGLASVFETLGRILVSPILFIILVILLIIYLVRRRRNSVESEVISATGPIEIKSSH